MIAKKPNTWPCDEPSAIIYLFIETYMLWIVLFLAIRWPVKIPKGNQQ